MHRPITYKTFDTIDQVLALPVSDPPRFVKHVKGKAFQDECVPYLSEPFKTVFETQKVVDGGDSKPMTTMGVAWDKLLFPKNKFCLSVIATQGTHWTPKGDKSGGMFDILNPTPFNLHECSHCEVMIVSMTKELGVLNPRFVPEFSSFGWTRNWGEQETTKIAGNLACNVIQQIADDLYDLSDEEDEEEEDEDCDGEDASWCKVHGKQNCPSTQTGSP